MITNNTIANEFNSKDFFILEYILGAKPLAGEKSETTKNINHWVNPIDLFDLLKKVNSEWVKVENKSQYDFNVIIQLGEDKTVATSIAKLISKYNKTIVMQLELSSHQWKVLHGDINVKPEGKIRWIAVGHGKYLGKNQETLFEGYNSKIFVDALKHIKNNILKNHQPDKIVLAGCELGRGGPSENFTFLTGVELAKHGIYLPIVGYSREISITKMGKKKISTSGFSSEVFSTKPYRLEIWINPDEQQVFINERIAALYFIDELKNGELDIWQLMKDSNSTALDVLRDNMDDIDIELVKTIAYNERAYEIFKSKLVGDLTNFRKGLIADFSNLGIREAPLWPMINVNPINDGSNRKFEGLTVIFRSGNGITGKIYAEKLASSDPNNTVVFQIDPNTMQFFIEYGDIGNLDTLSSQQWVIIDNIRSEPSFIQNLANSIDVAKNRYLLRKPENISVYLTDKKSFLDLEDKFEFTQQLAIRLKEKGINSNVNLEIYFDDERKLMFLLENIAINNIKKEYININRYAYLKGYFTLEDGNVDYEKINIAIYDPIVSKKVNQYFRESTGQEGFERWNANFEDEPNVSLKQQAIELKEVLKFISLQPERINYLSKPSVNRLSELFPAEGGFNYSDVLKLINDPVKLDDYNKDIENFLISYIEIKIPFGDKKSLGEEFKYVFDLKGKQNIKFSALLKILNKNSLKATVRKVESPIFYDDSINFLYILSDCDSLQEEEGSVKKHLNSLKHLMRRDALNEVTLDEKFILDQYRELYEKKSVILESMTENIDSQTHTAMINNIQNDQFIYFQADSEIYTIVSYNRDGIFYISLSDTAGVEITVSDADLVVAKGRLLDIFTRFINNEVDLDNEKSITRGDGVEFNRKVGEHLYGEVQIINTKSASFKNVRDAITVELDSLFEPVEISVIDDFEIIFGEQQTTLKKLRDIGANINGEPLNSKHTQQQNWKEHINFDEQKLTAKLAMIKNETEGIELASILMNSLSESDYENYISSGTTIQNQALLKEQLSIIYSSKVNESTISKETIHKLQKTGMKLPIYNRVANSVGQGIGGIGIFLTINNVYQLIDELDNPSLTEQERAELQKNLDLACANAFFNYGDMVLQPILLKLAYQQAGSFNVSSKITARITLIFSLIGMGLDVYQACEAFKQIDNITNSKDRQDLIVNGSLSIANIVVGGITVLGILIGSSTLPVVGLIVAGALLIGGMVYTGIRAVEKIEEELGASLKWNEKAREGIRAALGFKPSDEILNRFSYKQHIEFYKNAAWLRDLGLFKGELLHLDFEEHLQLISVPVLDVNDKYYIKYWASKNVIQSQVFFGDSPDSILSNIDVDEVGPCYTIEQINYIRDNFFYDGVNKKWVKSISSKEINYHNFNWRFSLIDKEAPFSYKEVGKIETDDILILNENYVSDFFDFFLINENMQNHYDSHKETSIFEQLKLLSNGDLRFFRSRNQYSNTFHPDFSPDEEVRNIGVEYTNSPDEIFKEISKNNKEIVFEGMHNIGYSFESIERRKNISLNLGRGKDIIIGKENAKNAFIFHGGVKFFAGGDKDDIVSVYFNNEKSNNSKNKIYFDGGKGENGIIINDIPEYSQIEIDLKINNGSIYTNGGGVDELYLKNVNNVTLNGQYNSIFSLYGNGENNILDVRSGECFVSGGAGYDRIYFESGIVNGDEGDDTYFLRRYGQSVNKTISNEDEPDIFLSATIIENKKGKSTVYLGYSLKEIKNISVVNNDIVVTIKIDDEQEKQEIQFNLTLKNAYEAKIKNRIKFHDYQLITRDGFVLTSQLNDINDSEPMILDHGIYTVNYQRKLDLSNKKRKAIVNVNTNKNIISIDNDSYLIDNWASMGFIENSSGLIYHGSNKNEKIILSNLNNKVIVSKGADVYQVITDEFHPGKLVFDYSEVQRVYEKNDSISIKFTTLSGYDLKIDNKVIYLENKFGDRSLEIEFINYNSINFDQIKIIDERNKLFKLGLDGDSVIIETSKDIIPTDGSDYIHFQPRYNFSSRVVDSLAGNDVIFDESGLGNIINGGNGNDKIVVANGENALYGGDGNDILYGGTKSDLLLSDLGDDILDGMEGDDYYIIDGRKNVGETIICDSQGVSNIYLIDFQQNYEIRIMKNGLYHIYTSNSNKRIVKIKVPKEEIMSSIKIYHHEQLPNHMPNYVNENMSNLVRYLAEQKSYVKQMSPLTPYHPFDEFKSKFTHSLPEKLSLTETSIRISPQSNPRHHVIHTRGTEQKVWDSSGHGRVFKAEAKKGGISIPNGSLANNVLYAAQGETNLSGGDGDDVFIANGVSGLITDESGKNLFVINGDLPGWNSLYSLGGENTIYLVNFKRNVTRESPDHISNATRYIYESENGRTVKIFQYPNTQAPTIVHQRWDIEEHTDNVSQKLEYLVNTLASLRMQDEMQNVANNNHDGISVKWEPVKLVKGYLNHMG
ncbi:C80 family cysteine peptidase [Providencia rettgeri]|nr:hypothetical protein [Providencia rettgeri]